MIDLEIFLQTNEKAIIQHSLTGRNLCLEKELVRTIFGMVCHLLVFDELITVFIRLIFHSINLCLLISWLCFSCRIKTVLFYYRFVERGAWLLLEILDNCSDFLWSNLYVLVREHVVNFFTNTFIFHSASLKKTFTEISVRVGRN